MGARSLNEVWSRSPCYMTLLFSTALFARQLRTDSMTSIYRIQSLMRPVGAVLAGIVISTLAIAGVSHAAAINVHFTDDKNSVNDYVSAATLSLVDHSDATLGTGVMFTLQATLSDPIFSSTSKIADLAFNGPSGGFNNFASAAFVSYRGDVLVDAISYTGGDGASVSGIKFNWSDNGTAFDTGGANAFTNGKTSTWFIGSTTVTQFSLAEFQNPFSVLHVNALVGGNAIWLLDGVAPLPSNVPEPATLGLILSAMGALAWTRRKTLRHDYPGCA